jgi:hypothetical protein
MNYECLVKTAGQPKGVRSRHPNGQPPLTAGVARLRHTRGAARRLRSVNQRFWVLRVEGFRTVKKMLVLALLGLGVAAVWRKVVADRAEIDLWTEATTAELN